MKEILASIEQKQKLYSQSPLFEYLQDESIHPIQRLAFAPCAAPFIMSFADLCKYVLRQEPTTDRIQAILNQHTYEDEFHWQWFLEDLDTLGFNCSLQLNDSFKFVWGEETQASRILTYQLYSYIVEAEPLEKLVILEAMEAASDVFMSFTRPVTIYLQSITQQEYKYFGDRHFDAESNHNAHSDDVNQFIGCIYVSDKTKHKSFLLIDKVFELFTQWNERLLNYAKNAQVSVSQNKQIVQEQILDIA